MKSLIGLLSLVLFCSTVFAQTEITKEEFSKTLNKAFVKKFTWSWRETTTAETFKEGTLFESTQLLSEFVHHRLKRFVLTKTREGISRRTEEITIGKTKYCKKDEEEWAVVKDPCVFGIGVGGPMNAVSAKYTVEETKFAGKKAKLFTEYILHNNMFVPDKNLLPGMDVEGLWFWERKYWLDKDGRLVRDELNKGLVQPQILTGRKVIVNEFSRDIRITAPIK